jgi:hypothetical protein
VPESFSSSTAFRNNASEAPHHLIEGRQDGETITNGQAEIEDRGIITDPGPPGNRARWDMCRFFSSVPAVRAYRSSRRVGIQTPSHSSMSRFCQY